jgi:hypothetical protein
MYNKKFGSIATIVLIIAISAAARYFNHKPVSKQELIKQTVAYVKKEKQLPWEIDKVTTAIDIREEPGAIRYVYVIHDMDVELLTDQKLKEFLAPPLCENVDTRKILDKDIHLEYSYQVEKSDKTFFVVVAKEDCVK